MNKIKDIGQNCVDCQKDTSFGSGLFVNRIPAENDNYSGYMCVDCQSAECEQCKDLTADVYFNDSCDTLCEDCHIDQVNKGLTSDKYGILEDFPE